MARYVYDLKDPASAYQRTTNNYFPNGEVSSICGVVTNPANDPHSLYWMLDTLMKKIPEGTDIHEQHMPHYHKKGYETFFVDSGSLWLFINGQKVLCKEGDIIHLQAGQSHGFAYLEDVKWRGTYHDYRMPDEMREIAAVGAAMPDLAKDPELLALNPGTDNIKLEPFVYTEVPAEQCWAVKHPDRPQAEYKFDGLTMKVIIERWENGGVKELCCAQMQPGLTIEWDKYPKLREMFYVRKGKVKFTIMGEEYIVDSESVVDIPRFAPHSIEVLEETEMYDLGGQTYWSLFLQNYESIRQRDPKRLEDPKTLEELKAKFDMPVKSISMKK